MRRRRVVRNFELTLLDIVSCLIFDTYYCVSYHLLFLFNKVRGRRRDRKDRKDRRRERKERKERKDRRERLTQDLIRMQWWINHPSKTENHQT